MVKKSISKIFADRIFIRTFTAKFEEKQELKTTIICVGALAFALGAESIIIWIIILIRWEYRQSTPYISPL